MESRIEITRCEMAVLPSSEAKDTTATTIVYEEEKVGQDVDSNLKTKSGNPPPVEVLPSSGTKDMTAEMKSFHVRRKKTRQKTRRPLPPSLPRMW